MRPMAGIVIKPHRFNSFTPRAHRQKFPTEHDRFKQEYQTRQLKISINNFFHGGGKKGLMTRKILINAHDSDECRIVTIKENKLEELHLDTAAREMTQGNIYKASITRVEPSLQAVFVDYGTQKNGFLQLNEIHSDYFLDNDAGDRKINNLVKKGQELIVQVTKDPIMHKGAMLTTFISLPGRLSVLMPGSTTRGVSRQIIEEEERKRLKSIIESVKIPEGFGLIVRTAGKDATKNHVHQ